MGNAPKLLIQLISTGFTFKKGGSGIFALTAEQCRRYRKLFEEQV